MLVPWPMRDDLVLWVIWGSSAVVLGAALGLAYSLVVDQRQIVGRAKDAPNHEPDHESVEHEQESEPVGA